MASSRIFIRGLPPSLSEDEFRKHFSRQSGITDAKFFPQRRIGYVGYKSPEDAAKAVKYFNKTFIRMSRIAVEIARPIADAPPKHRQRGQRGEYSFNGTTIKDEPGLVESQNPLKRKRTRPEAESRPTSDAKDAKLAEYLQIMTNSGKSKPWEDMDTSEIALNGSDVAKEPRPEQMQTQMGDSDDEYQSIGRSAKRKQVERAAVTPADEGGSPHKHTEADDKPAGEDFSGVEKSSNEPEKGPNNEGDGNPPTAVSDSDWLRSRTSRLLGLLDEDEEETHRSRGPKGEEDQEKGARKAPPVEDVLSENLPRDSSPPAVDNDEEAPAKGDVSKPMDADESAIRESSRLFLRNLPFNATEDDLRAHLAAYGQIEEVHIPMETMKGVSKGIAYVQFLDDDSAFQAYQECDGKIFQGRLLHVLPAAVKRESKLDEYAISQLPLKKQRQIRRKAEAAASTFSWNSLYMNADAVMSSVSDRLGVDKAALLDPTSSDAAVKQALAETHVIQETKTYFTQNGVDLEAFKRRSWGDTAVLVKNFPYGTKSEELRKMFEEHGKVIRFLMPPSGTIAIVEFGSAPVARSAFASLAYRKIKNSVLFLEKAPSDLFTKPAASVRDAQKPTEAPVSATDLIQSKEDAEVIDTTTLFVRNLNFSTTSQRLAENFEPLEGFLSARVKTKANPKKPEETLSMGFGFLEFRTKANAKAALATMDGYNLDGHQLVIKASQKNLDAAEERRREDRAKKLAAQKSKVIIKNLPFETSKKDVRELLRQYGQLRTVRLPKKFDSSARGFAFAEFTSPREAANAMAALGNTHLLGRKLVMEFAAEDPEDAEEQIERMAKKVGDQSDKVALQKLVGGGRRKFNVTTGDEDGHPNAEL